MTEQEKQEIRTWCSEFLYDEPEAIKRVNKLLNTLEQAQEKAERLRKALEKIAEYQSECVDMSDFCDHTLHIACETLKEESE